MEFFRIIPYSVSHGSLWPPLLSRQCACKSHHPSTFRLRSFITSRFHPLKSIADATYAAATQYWRDIVWPVPTPFLWDRQGAYLALPISGWLLLPLVCSSTVEAATPKTSDILRFLGLFPHQGQRPSPMFVVAALLAAICRSAYLLVLTWCRREYLFVAIVTVLWLSAISLLFHSFIMGREYASNVTNRTVSF